MYSSAKKAVLAVAVCSAFAGISSAMADPVTMTFTGNITKTTCDIQPYNSTGTLLNSAPLFLGEKTASEKAGDIVDFTLKNSTGTCTGLTNGGGAYITWTGDLDEHGLKNTNGTNKSVHIEITPVTGGTSEAEIDTNPIYAIAGQVITSNHNTVSYSKAGGELNAVLPFIYKVKFMPNTSGAELGAGTISTNISYTVAYK